MSSPQSLPNYERNSAALRSLEAEKTRRESQNRLAAYRPYTKQATFHAAGATKRERLFMAANQVGKTVAGSMEGAMHATGIYPDWWQGRRFDKPTNAWAAGVTGESTRDNVQRLLIGRVGSRGTGAIPGNLIIAAPPARGVPDLVDNILVRHKSGGVSTIFLKSYEKGREKWQGESLDWIWFDEEPPLDIYTEGLTRTNAAFGPVWITFTPLLGMSDVVSRFIMETNDDRHVTQMEIGEAEHFTPEQRASIIASYPAHEVEARTKGVPVLGSGRVYPVTEELLRIDAIAIPKAWVRIAGLDIGWDHPTAVAWLAWDRDTDTIYVYDCYRLREATPVVHSAAIKGRGAWIPVAWPHDALQHDKGNSGEKIAQLYREQGVNMLPSRATFEDEKSSGVEAGVLDILDRMQTGRFKVFAHLNDWWEEFRLYHRKDGLIVKERDDLMSATRYAAMMRRYAKVEPVVSGRKPQSRGAGGWMA